MSAGSISLRMKRLRSSIRREKSLLSGSMLAMIRQKVAITWPHAIAPKSISITAMACSTVFRGVAARSPYPIEVMVIIEK